MRAMLDTRHDLTLCRPIVGDDLLGRTALFLHQTGQQAPGSLGVATFLGDFVKHITILVNRPP
jgi:hypothetical protein